MGKKKITVFQLLALLPLVVEAARQIGAEVVTATEHDSEGGKKVTPEEVMKLTDKAHAALRPLALEIVKLATKD